MCTSHRLDSRTSNSESSSHQAVSNRRPGPRLQNIRPLKHSNASIRLSPREFLSRVMSLLKARSHSQDVARQENISKDQRWRVVKASSISGRPHQAVGSNSSVEGIAEMAVEYLRNSSVTVSSPFLRYSHSSKASLFFTFLCGARCV